MSTQDSKDTKSFWTTLPGILTGAAALVTAIATLIGALNAMGVFTPATPTPPVGATSTLPASATSTVSAPAITFTFEPNPAKRGEEVQLHLSSALDNAIVYFNGRALPKKVLANGKTYVITIPADATNGFFELEWSGGRVKSSVQMNITQ